MDSNKRGNGKAEPGGKGETQEKSVQVTGLLRQSGLPGSHTSFPLRMKKEKDL